MDILKTIRITEFFFNGIERVRVESIGVYFCHRWLICWLSYPPWNEFSGF
jgi:hypothetical protein